MLEIGAWICRLLELKVVAVCLFHILLVVLLIIVQVFVNFVVFEAWRHKIEIE